MPAKNNKKDTAATSSGGASQPDSAALWRALKKNDESDVIELLFVPAATAAADGEDDDGSAVRLVPRAGARAVVNTPAKDGTYPLLYAVQNSFDAATVERLIEAGAAVDAAGEKGERQTPLIAACWGEDDVLAQVLLARGAKLDPTDASGRSCLHVCAMLGCHGLLAHILGRAASASERAALLAAKDTTAGATPLQLAVLEMASDDARYRRTADEICEALGFVFSGPTNVAAPADPKAAAAALAVLASTDNTRSNVVHTAVNALSGSARHAAALARVVAVAMAADPDGGIALTAADEDGNTPLHLLAMDGAAASAFFEVIPPSAPVGPALRSALATHLSSSGESAIGIALEQADGGFVAGAVAAFERATKGAKGTAATLFEGADRAALAAVLRGHLLGGRKVGLEALVPHWAGTFDEGTVAAVRAEVEAAVAEEQAQLLAAEGDGDADANNGAQQQQQPEGNFTGISSSGQRSVAEKIGAAKAKHGGKLVQDEAPGAANNAAGAGGLSPLAWFVIAMLALGFLLPVIEFLFPSPDGAKIRRR